MDKLSLYEILSFFIPGFILIKIIEVYYHAVFHFNKLFFTECNFSESIMFLTLSLFVGIIIHVLSFRILNSPLLKWYNKLIYKPVPEIIKKSKFIEKPIDFLNSEYKRIRKHDEVKNDNYEKHLFDFAYYYLEINNKISPAKSFQSLYFWFRNMFTINLFLFPISIIIYIIAQVKYDSRSQITSLEIIILSIILGVLIVPIANWLRKKLVERVLWSYYIERVHEIDK